MLGSEGQKESQRSAGLLFSVKIYIGGFLLPRGATDGRMLVSGVAAEQPGLQFACAHPADVHSNDLGDALGECRFVAGVSKRCVAVSGPGCSAKRQRDQTRDGDTRPVFEVLTHQECCWTRPHGTMDDASGHNVAATE